MTGNNMRALLAVSVSWLLAPVAHAAAASAATAADGKVEDRAAITRILKDEEAGWAAGDADAFAAHASPDIIFANTVGMFSVGKPPFVAQHKTIFSTIYKGSTLREYLSHLVFLKPDVAVVDVVCKLTGFPELPAGVEAVDGALYTRLQQVIVKSGGAWSVVSFHNVPIQPRFVTDDVRALTSDGQ